MKALVATCCVLLTGCGMVTYVETQDMPYTQLIGQKYETLDVQWIKGYSNFTRSIDSTISKYFVSENRVAGRYVQSEDMLPVKTPIQIIKVLRCIDCTKLLWGDESFQIQIKLLFSEQYSYIPIEKFNSLPITMYLPSEPFYFEGDRIFLNKKAFELIE